MSKVKIESKEKPISDLLRAGLMIALDFIKSALTKRIENEIVDESVVRAVARLKEVVTVLNDNDPNNKAQTLTILRNFVKVDVTEVVYQILLQEIDDIKDEDIRLVAIFVLDNAVNIVNILTDEDADNATQFKNFLNYLRRDEATQDLLADHILDPLLEKINVSPELRSIIIDFILKALSGDASKTTELTASLKAL
jgi:hypothetical protein